MRNLFSSSSAGVGSLHQDGDRLEGSSLLKGDSMVQFARSTSSLDQLKIFDADGKKTGVARGMVTRSPMPHDQCVPQVFGGSISRDDEEIGEDDDEEGAHEEEEEELDAMSVMHGYEEEYDGLGESDFAEDPDAPKSINSLPVEILALILSQVPHVDTVRSCSLVSRKWESAAKVR